MPKLRHSTAQYPYHYWYYRTAVLYSTTVLQHSRTVHTVCPVVLEYSSTVVLEYRTMIVGGGGGMKLLDLGSQAWLFPDDTAHPPAMRVTCCKSTALPPCHPFFPSCAAAGQCVLTAAAAGVPCGVVSASAGPSSWRTGGCAGFCGGRFAGFAAHCPPRSGRPPHASPRFRVREAQWFHPSACCPGRPPPASSRRHVSEAKPTPPLPP